MRLTCPNCGAVYDVDANAIPPEGRDVQCSNCGHGWFQPHPEAGAGSAATLGTAASPFASEDTPPDDAGTTAADHPAAAHDEPGPATPGDEAPQVSPRRPRHRMDEAVRSILREEAERESRTRRVGADGLESQSDLGLASGRGGPAPMQGSGPEAPRAPEDGDHPPGDGPHPAEPEPWEESDAGPDTGTHTRHGARFADIEDVSETIAAHEAQGAGQAALAALPEAETPPRRNRFGVGLGIALLIGAVAVALYLYAAAIVKLVPAAGPLLSDYVTLADSLRIEVQRALLPLAETLRGLLGELLGGAAR